MHEVIIQIALQTARFWLMFARILKDLERDALCEEEFNIASQRNNQYRWDRYHVLAEEQKDSCKVMQSMSP